MLNVVRIHIVRSIHLHASCTSNECMVGYTDNNIFTQWSLSARLIYLGKTTLALHSSCARRGVRISLNRDVWHVWF